MKQSSQKSRFLAKKITPKGLTKKQLLAIRGGNDNEVPPPPPDPIIGTVDIVDF